MQEATFVLNFFHDFDYMRKLKLEKRELQPPVGLGTQDIPHQRVARPDLAGTLFRYLNCCIDFQSVCYKSIFIYASHLV